MLGNDVVDLELARHQTRWKTEAFQQKTLHPLEIEKAKNKPLSGIDFWKIWSIKETAYKAHQRKYNHPARINPFQFFVEFLSENKSTVRFQEDEYKVSTYFDSDLIYSFTQGLEFQSVQNFDFEAKNSHFQKNLKRSHLDSNLIKNKNGIPFWKDKAKTSPISITHHGKFFAYLICSKID